MGVINLLVKFHIVFGGHLRISLLPLLLMGLLQGRGHNFLTLFGRQLILVNIHPSYAVYKEEPFDTYSLRLRRILHLHVRGIQHKTYFVRVGELLHLHIGGI